MVGRVVGVLLASSISIHLLMAGMHWAVSGWVTGVSLAMALACLPCLRGLWRGPRLHHWLLTAGMAAVMLGVHLPLALASTARPTPGVLSGWWCSAASMHIHGQLLAGVTSWTPGPSMTGMGAQHQALMLTAVLLSSAELCAALFAIARLTVPISEKAQPHPQAAHPYSPVSPEPWARPKDLTRKLAR